jgi:hypothetical protein
VFLSSAEREFELADAIVSECRMASGMLAIIREEPEKDELVELHKKNSTATTSHALLVISTRSKSKLGLLSQPTLPAREHPSPVRLAANADGLTEHGREP